MILIETFVPVSEAVTQRCSLKNVLRNFAKFTEKHLCQSLFFNKVAGAACNFIKKETLAQVFSCEFCEISKNTFSYRAPLVAAFFQFVEYSKKYLQQQYNIEPKGQVT